MKIHIPAFRPMLKINEHLAHGEIDIDLGEDIVQVVRCKDCCCSEEYTAADGKTYYTCDELQLTGLEPEHFCSYGERKIDNG